jgi:ABC-type multidrug transport system fused ATPase/permease subunit
MQPKDKIIVEGVSFFYGRNRVLNDIAVNFTEHTITAIMGASGQGKSTFLGLFNRLWDDVADARVEGKILIRLADKWVSPIGRSPSAAPAAQGWDDFPRTQSPADEYRQEHGFPFEAGRYTR